MLVQADNRRIYYDVVGEEDAPVVCLAHALSADGGVWAAQVPALLAAGLRVLRIDMRGHGGSDPGQGGYTMSSLADDVVRVLNFLKIERAHFVGLSIGGMIGQTFAIEHPHRLVSLMLCGTSPMTIPGGKELWDTRFKAISQVGSVEPLADASMQRWFTDAFKIRMPERWRQIRETIANTTPDGYMGGAQAIMKFNVIDKLPSVSARTLVLCGDEDTGTPPAGNKQIAALIPGARYVEMRNARHLAMAEHPAVFNPIMLEWLRGES